MTDKQVERELESALKKCVRILDRAYGIADRNGWHSAAQTFDTLAKKLDGQTYAFPPDHPYYVSRR